MDCIPSIEDLHNIIAEELLNHALQLDKTVNLLQRGTNKLKESLQGMPITTTVMDHPLSDEDFNSLVTEILQKLKKSKEVQATVGIPYTFHRGLTNHYCWRPSKSYHST